MRPPPRHRKPAPDGGAFRADANETPPEAEADRPSANCNYHRNRSTIPSIYYSYASLSDMRYRQSYQAAPIRPKRRYRNKRIRPKVLRIAALFSAAVLLGATGGLASAGGIPTWAEVSSAVKPLAVAMGLARARAPQEGDNWSSCSAARAAGTAPIYAGEPGYRSALDRDADGIACEPYRGLR